MPLGGEDTRYDLSDKEQDIIRRRIALKARLKAENVRKRYDPFLSMKNVHFTDPAVDRYQDLRKTGRMPNTPFKPKLFFTLLGMVVIPIYGLNWIWYYERTPYLAACATGDIPYKDRKGGKIVAGVTGL